MNIEIEGKIIKKLYVETIYSKDFPNKSFSRNRIVVECDEENLVLEFSDSKIHFLDFCNPNQLVRFFCKLKVSSWTSQNKTYYSNDLICRGLKIIKTIKNYKHPISINGEKYILKRTKSENLSLGLININTDEYLNLTHPYEFPNKDLNKTHVFIQEKFYGNVLETLYKNGILNSGFFLSNQEGQSGYVCEVLVLHLFNIEGYLPISYSSVSHISNKYIGHFTYDGHEPSVDETDYSNFNDDLDYDQQSDKFWNQF